MDRKRRSGRSAELTSGALVSGVDNDVVGGSLECVDEGEVLDAPVGVARKVIKRLWIIGEVDEDAKMTCWRYRTA